MLNLDKSLKCYRYFPHFFKPSCTFRQISANEHDASAAAGIGFTDPQECPWTGCGCVCDIWEKLIELKAPVIFESAQVQNITLAGELKIVL